MDDNDQLRKLDDLMARLQRIMHVSAATHDWGLTATQAFILRIVDKHEMVRATEIAKAVGLSPGAVTQVCDELVKNRLIDRTRSETDRRVVQIALTPEGRSVLERLRAQRTERMYEIVRRLGQPDAGEFIRLMGRVVDIVEEMKR